MDYTKIERPVEPFSESENPEQWCRVLAWEEARAEQAEAERDEACALLERYDKVTEELKAEVDRLREFKKQAEFLVSQSLINYRHAQLQKFWIEYCCNEDEAQKEGNDGNL